MEHDSIDMGYLVTVNPTVECARILALVTRTRATAFNLWFQFRLAPLQNECDGFLWPCHETAGEGAEGMAVPVDPRLTSVEPRSTP
jgi:hypothetical protein